VAHEAGEEQGAARQTVVYEQTGWEEAASFSSVLQCQLPSCTNSDKTVVFWRSSASLGVFSMA